MFVKDSTSKLFHQSLVYKPFNYPEFYELMKQHETVHWVTAEAELGDDVTD